MMNFTKKYQVWEAWERNEAGFSLAEYDTLQEAITAPKTGDWYITKRVSLSITDAEEQPVIAPTIPYVPPKSDEQKAEPDPGEELAARYAAGPIGNIST